MAFPRERTAVDQCNGTPNQPNSHNQHRHNQQDFQQDLKERILRHRDRPRMIMAASADMNGEAEIKTPNPRDNSDDRLVLSRKDLVALLAQLRAESTSAIEDEDAESESHHLTRPGARSRQNIAKRLAKQSDRSQSARSGTTTNVQQTRQSHEPKDTVPLSAFVLKCMLTVVIFFVLFVPVQYFILDPARGVTHHSRAEHFQKIMQNICPQGGLWRQSSLYLVNT